MAACQVREDDPFPTFRAYERHDCGIWEYKPLLKALSTLQARCRSSVQVDGVGGAVEAEKERKLTKQPINQSQDIWQQAHHHRQPELQHNIYTQLRQKSTELRRVLVAPIFAPARFTARIHRPYRIPRIYTTTTTTTTKPPSCWVSQACNPGNSLRKS